MAKMLGNISQHESTEDESTDGVKDSKATSLPSQFHPSRILALNSLQTNDQDVYQPLVLVINRVS